MHAASGVETTAPGDRHHSDRRPPDDRQADTCSEEKPSSLNLKNRHGYESLYFYSCLMLLIIVLTATSILAGTNRQCEHLFWAAGSVLKDQWKGDTMRIVVIGGNRP